MGWEYTGIAGGPKRTETPTAIWAKEAAEKEKSKSPKINQRKDRVVFIGVLFDTKLTINLTS